MVENMKVKLSRSLREMLEQKKLSKITISDITSNCGCSRMTFYYHFQNIFELLTWMIRNEYEVTLDGERDPRKWERNLLSICRFIYNNRVVVNNIHTSLKKEESEACIKELVFDLIIDTIESYEGAEKVSEVDRNFIADFYKYAIIGTIFEWIDKGLGETPEDIVESFHLIVEGALEKAIVNFSDENIMLG